MISEERFVQNINLLHLAVVAGNEKENPYRSIIHNLHKDFPPDESGYSEIEFYCFSENFGKDGRGNYREPSELYQELLKQNKHKTQLNYENRNNYTRQSNIRRTH